MAYKSDTRYTILVVDDNPDLLELLEEGLAAHFTIVVARDGVEGLTSIVETHPDCAIIDVKMPGLNGLQVVRALRGDAATSDIPLIILTAIPEEQGLLAISHRERNERARSLVKQGEPEQIAEIAEIAESGEKGA